MQYNYQKSKLTTYLNISSLSLSVPNLQHHFYQHIFFPFKRNILIIKKHDSNKGIKYPIPVFQSRPNFPESFSFPNSSPKYVEDKD